MALTKIDDRGLKTPIDLQDNEKIRLGTGNDLEIYHSGSGSYVSDVGTGSLYIQGENLVLENTSGTNYFAGVSGAEAILYHNGNAKLATTSSGVTVTGTLEATTYVAVPDQIYHVGDADTTVRFPAADTIALETAGSERLRVDSSGFIGIGMTPGSGTGYVLQLDSGAAQTFMTFGNSGSGNGATNGLVVGNDTARAYFTQRENQPIFIATNNTDRIAIDANGKVGVGTLNPSNLVHCVTSDTTVARFESTASGGTGVELLLHHNSSSPADNDNIGAIYFQADDDAGNKSTFGVILANAEDVSNGSEDGHLRFETASNGTVSERMRIASDGKVGIGTSSPVRQLHVNESAHVKHLLLANNAGGSDVGTTPALYSPASGALAFSGNSNERMRMDGSGRLLIGTSTASSAGDSQYSRLEVSGNTSNAAGPGHLTIKRGEVTSSLSSGDTLGRLIFSSLDGGNYGYIMGSADAAPGSSDYPGRITFFTTPDGSSSAAERMRIDKDGHVGIGMAPSGMRLDVQSAANDVARFSGINSGSITIRNDTSNEVHLHTASNDALIFGTNGENERMRINKDGVIITKNRGGNTPRTYEFNYNDGAGGSSQTVNLATISNYNGTMSAVAEVTYVGVYGTAQDLLAGGKWICTVRRANSNAAWAQTAEEVALSGNGSNASLDIGWSSGVLQATTVGPWMGWTVNVRITIINGDIGVNV